MNKSTPVDLAVIEKAKQISKGWITEDRWLRYAFFGYRYQTDGVNEKIQSSRITRLERLGLINLEKIEGNYAYYKVSN